MIREKDSHKRNLMFGFIPQLVQRRRGHIILIFLLFSGKLPEAVARPLAVPVANYALQCDETFSCPKTLLPRVSFWIEVFSRWDTNTAILHDKDYPHRVYSTIKRDKACRRSRKGGPISRERKRLQGALKSIAAKLVAGKPLSESQLKLKSLFPDSSAPEIRAAAHRIRCQSGNRDRMEEALRHFAIYRPTILDALESQNLTTEYQYLPFVESAFNPKALSHVGAAGLWQIMPSTGRTLGLTINQAVDERYDPTRATYAAAMYFRDSVDKLSESAFENGYPVTPRDLNPFVITSYNYGVRGMQRAIKQVGLSYERLLREYKSPNFQTAVKNFYASFLAARHVAKNADVFFPPASQMPKRIYSYNVVVLPRATSAKRLHKELQLDLDLFKRLNPALKKVVWNNKALIPKGYKIKLPYHEAGWDLAMTELLKLPAEFERPGFIWHRVKRGQTACEIAERYRASCRALIRLNRLNKRRVIYVGQRLKVPTGQGGVGVSGHRLEQRVAASNSESKSQSYRVRAGDTACGIASRNIMKCAEFLALNGLTRSSVLRIGQKVVISKPNDWHTVRRGQTPCGIANNYRVACSALLDANRLRRSSTIYVGQRLRIPARG